MPDKKIEKFIYYPMLISEDENESVVDKDAPDSEWDKLRNLPKEKKDALLSKELSLKIFELQKTFSLQDIYVGHIGIFIRKIFFGELSIEQAEAKIGSMLMMTGGDPNQAKAIVQFIQNEIMTIKPKPQAEDETTEEKPKVNIVNLPLLQALSKFEQLGQQLITQERIKVKSQPDPVRPSLFYWIKYYRDELGIGFHDNVQRGQFLFHSVNGKKLRSEERERLNLILKSIEEDFPLQIDTERQAIVFPVIEKSQPQSSSHAPTVEQSERDQSVRSVHPSEPKDFLKSQTISSRPSQRPFIGKQISVPYETGGFRIGRGMNFNNVKEAPLIDENQLSFSSNHLFPAEQERPEHRVTPKEKPRVSETPKPPKKAVPPNPFHIHPVTRQKKDEV